MPPFSVLFYSKLASITGIFMLDFLAHRCSSDDDNKHHRPQLEPVVEYVCPNNPLTNHHRAANADVTKWSRYPFHQLNCFCPDPVKLPLTQLCCGPFSSIVV